MLDPFHTSKPVGRGTLLDTARRIVEERHGGSPSLDTSPHGTTFHVRPALQPPRQRPAG